MQKILHLDWETFSAADIKNVGAHRYAHDPSTEILCCAVAEHGKEPELWLPEEFCHFTDWYTYDQHLAAYNLLRLVADPNTIIYAHNAPFEIAISDALWLKTFGFAPPSHRQWRCTAAMARRAALPWSLGKLSEKLDLKNKKDKAGDALIRVFSIPQKKGNKKLGIDPGERITPEHDPERFRQFCEYCMQDVRAEQEVHGVLWPFELTGMVLEAFLTDIEINSRGIPVNLLALENAQRMIETETARITEEFRQLTGLNPSQNTELLKWLKARGYSRENLQATTIDEVLEYMPDFELQLIHDTQTRQEYEVCCALQLRKQFSYAAVKKIPKMLACAGPHDNKVRGCLIFCGAGPGRWTASLIQPQNFKRPTIKYTEGAYRLIEAGEPVELIKFLYGNPLEVISSSIRHFIHDSECHCGGNNCDVEFFGCGEHPMLSADYNAIESRIVCWLAGQEDALEEYRQDVDRYCRMAQHIYGEPELHIKKMAKADVAEYVMMRFIGKQCILGCGFGMGVDKYIANCAKFGKTVSRELAEKAVGTWRVQHPSVVSFWYDTERAAKNAIQNKGQRYMVGKLCFFSMDVAGMHYLFMKLPSGRTIAYPQVSIVYDTPDDVPTDAEWNAMSPEEKSFLYNDVKPVAKPPRKDRGRITYYAQLPNSQQWGRVDTYGGKLVENGTQGTAADIMMMGTINAERAGLPAATLVHDEFLGYMREPHHTIENLIANMTRLPAWADGLPIAAEGKVVPFYKK